MVFFKKFDSLNFPESLPINQKLYYIEVDFSKKRSSSVSIKNNTIAFKLSSYLTKKQAEEHFSSLLKRIVKKIENSPAISNQKSFEEILERGEFEFANETYSLEHTKNRGIKLKENTFHLNVHSKLENIEKTITKLLIERYYDKTYEYVKALNQQTYNYSIKDFQLKLVNSKWGHCSHDNVIMLNIKLLNASIEVLNYVIFHEISHIMHKNHSESFWKEVARFCPNYKVLRKELRVNPPQIFK